MNWSLIDYVKNCLVYVSVSKTIYRLGPIKPILIEDPDVRYDFVIIYLNADLAFNFDYLYILSILVIFFHFLHKKFIYHY